MEVRKLFRKTFHLFSFRTCILSSLVFFRRMIFETLTDAAWEHALRRSRSYSNSISAQIKMRLHPQNPTPGFQPRQQPRMIKFDPFTVLAPGPKERVSFKCQVEDRTVGYLHQEEDGIYSFYPNHVSGMRWNGGHLKEIAYKMDALNLPQAIPATD